jgi:hypothetical protein
MGLEPLLQELQLNDDQVALRSQFFEATGYGPSDLLSINYANREFLTVNGGRYQFTGNELVHIAGPSPALEDRWEF